MEVKNTKRSILKVTSTIYDPLGHLMPFTVVAKILLQELWRHDIGWDDEITGDHLRYWEAWLKNAEKIVDVRVPRCYVLDGSPFSEIQLHVFCDASESAYGAVAYLRYSSKLGGHQCSLVMSKSKLAPIKTVTLARLELGSGLVGARLSTMILHELDIPIDRTFFWVDSMLALQYIQNTSQRFKVYVANRVTEILRLTSKEQWNHVPGKINPADMLTRGIKDPSDLMTTNSHGTSWFTSTEFLHKDESEWHNTVVDPLDPNDEEIKRKSILVALGFVELQKVCKIDISRFSSWTKLKHSASWFLRLIDIFKNKQFQQILLD